MNMGLVLDAIVFVILAPVYCPGFAGNTKCEHAINELRVCQAKLIVSLPISKEQKGNLLERIIHPGMSMKVVQRMLGTPFGRDGRGLGPDTYIVDTYFFEGISVTYKDGKVFDPR
jgi:hypothetical protein